MGDPPSAAARTLRRLTLDGEALRAALHAGAEALRQQADAINAINVFPVPDGDTGTNMHSTMRAAADEMARADSADDAAAVLKAAAQGALMGAKGNSGVILSQILSGLAALPEGAALDGSALAAGLERARAAAYRVVSAPKEGTIHTAISAAAAGAAGAHASVEEALAAAVDAARDAVARTPELLPVLKEAGVVDSGAQGLYVLLDGMLRSIRGESAASVSDGLGRIDASWLSATQQLHEHGAEAGFCTEFVVSGDALDTDAIRARLLEMGESVLVIGGGDVVRVHVHTRAPDDALAYARTLGEVSHEKVDDMEAQFRALASAQITPTPTGGVAVVAVAAGEGLRALFASMGATVVHGGQTMNPSAGDIRAAIQATGAADVIVLPNNKNILMAARQAAEGLPGRVRVLETRSVPQGVAALVALNAEEPFEENVAGMEAAAQALRSAEVTLAARATRLHGMAIAEGQPIGIVDGDLVVAEATVAGAVRACVAKMLDGRRQGALVTLYAGEGEDEVSREALASALREAFGVEVEGIDGGQPHYPYLISVE